HRDLINAAIDGAGLDADAHRSFGVWVLDFDVVSSRRDRTISVKRRTQRAASLQLELVSHTGKWLLLGPGEERPGDWMVDGGQLRRRSLRRARRQRVRSQRGPGDASRQRTA